MSKAKTHKGIPIVIEMKIEMIKVSCPDCYRDKDK